MAKFLILIAAFITLNTGVASTALAVGGKGDDVFIDEGDGDFDSLPSVPPQAQGKKVPVETPAEKPVEKSVNAAAPASQPPTSQPSNSQPANVPVADAAKSGDSDVAPVDPVEPKAKVKKSISSKKSHAKTADRKKSAAGIYVTTQGPCPMTREPASESEAMLTVKAAKKIWVEEVDEKWVRGFNKAGEPGYISRECVK